MCKKCWGIVSILVLVLIAGAYKFLISGDTKISPDKRIAIQLTAPERNLVLAEMRTFLSTIQQISSGLTSEDFELIAKQSRISGLSAQQEVPGSLMGKLPIEFKKLGFDTHKKFDALALDAEQLEDKEHSLNQMSKLMTNCIACHAAYKIETINSK